MQFIDDASKLSNKRYKLVMPLGMNETTYAQEAQLCTQTISIHPFLSQYPLSAHQRHILLSISGFFTEHMIKDVLHPYANHESIVSLRCLDWLVTNFSKKYNIVCEKKDGEMFNIFAGYKLALSNHRRRNFDPFRRRLRIFYLHEEKTYETTVGQANFLHWASKNGVIQYATRNRDAIERDMNESNIRKRNKKAKKRGELSKAPSNRCFLYNIETALR